MIESSKISPLIHFLQKNSSLLQKTTNVGSNPSQCCLQTFCIHSCLIINHNSWAMSNPMDASIIVIVLSPSPPLNKHLISFALNLNLPLLVYIFFLSRHLLVKMILWMHWMMKVQSCVNTIKHSQHPSSNWMLILTHNLFL